MKVNKFIYGALMLATAGATFTSCKESFLDEVQINAQDTDYFKTKNGIDDMITGAYSIFKFRTNYSWGYGLYNLGIDEYTDANNEVQAMNGYTTLTPGEGTYVPQLWDNMYNRIETANQALANIDNAYKGIDGYSTRKGEAFFIRGYGYFELVKIYGAVPLKLTPSTTVETYFPRNTEEECYAQIISDLEEAYKLLPETASQTGRLTKSAAAHFLAKAHLFRASELYSKWNAKYVDADLKAVIDNADIVLAKHKICDNFEELWDYKEADGANEKVPEIILAGQFSADEATWGRFGSQAHLAFPCVYQDMAGTKRDISGDREFCYLRTTNYTLDVYDRVNDSRFWKTFITVYGCNSTANAPKYTDAQSAKAQLPAGVSVGDPRFVGGDAAIRYIVNDAGDNDYKDMGTGEAEVSVNGVMQAPHTFVRYFAGEAKNWVTGHGNYGNYAQKKRFVANGKHRDGYRNAIASQFGTRDFILARSAEDILMKAEAYARQKKDGYKEAIAELNKLRDRAAYADGESRTIHKDGGQAYLNNPYCTGKGGGFGPDGAIFSYDNTYLESNKMAADPKTSTQSAMHLNDVSDITGSARDNAIFEALKATGGEMFSGDETYQKVMNFILNERTRELTGEYLRWEDLARCRQLEVRHKAFNDAGVRNQGTFDKNIHYYRPIPQHFLDACTDANGKHLTDEAKKNVQNPGY